MARVNYVFCAYFGPRRQGDPRAASDPMLYVRAHLDSLATTRHDLAQVTMVVNGDYDREALRQVVADSKVPVVTIERENVGMSYGAYAHAFHTCGSDFTHYIFAEDDCTYREHHFDATLLRWLEEVPRTGMVCGYVPQGHPHAAVFTGISPRQALLDVVALRGDLPYFCMKSDRYTDHEMGGQVAWSQALIDAGWPLRDWLHERSSAFADQGFLRWPGGDLTKPSFIAPSQLVGRRIKLEHGPWGHFDPTTGLFVPG